MSKPTWRVVAVAAVISAIGLLSAWSAAQSSTAQSADGARSRPFGPVYSSASTVAPEAAIQKANDIFDSPKPVADRLNLPVAIPTALGKAQLRRSMITKTGVTPRLGRFEYDGNRNLQVWDLGTAGEAQEWLRRFDSHPDISPHLRTVEIGQFEGRAVDRLDVPPVDGADGVKTAGTGIVTGGARVFWVVGKFGIQLSDYDPSSAELEAAAVDCWGK